LLTIPVYFAITPVLLKNLRLFSYLKNSYDSTVTLPLSSYPSYSH